MTSTIGLISPGAMGTAVGAAAVSNSHQVIFAGQDRSDRTLKRAEDAGLTNCHTIENLCNQSDIILSICPPHDANQVAQSVLGTGFEGIFVDGNAIAPDATRTMSESFAAARFVDGGIIGGPPWQADDKTVLYLCGHQAKKIAAIFDNTPLQTQVISTEIGQASALKMVFAAYTKGTTALLAAILGVAENEGVRQALESQWGETFTTQTHRRLTANSAKAWRFAGEMKEIAATFESAGLPPGFHLSAAAIFERLEAFKDQPADDIDVLLTTLTKQQP